MIDNHGGLIELGVAPSKQAAEREFRTHDVGEATVTELQSRPITIALSEPSDVQGTRTFLVYPLPDELSLYTTAPAGAYRIRIPYIKLLPALVAGNNETNWFTNNAEEFITYGACSIGFYFNHDETRGDIWFKRAAQEVKDVLARDKNESVSGNTTLNVSFDALGPKVPYADGGSFRGDF